MVWWFKFIFSLELNTHFPQLSVTTNSHHLPLEQNYKDESFAYKLLELALVAMHISLSAISAEETYTIELCS